MDEPVRSNVLTEVETPVDKIVSALGTDRSSIVPILKQIQSHYNYLPDEALRRVCKISRVTPAEIESVVSFYPQFRRKPAGKHIIRVCVGTACHVKGAEQILDAFRHVLGMTDGEDTDADGLFTVEQAACLGCCMLAPAVQIDNSVYGHLTRQRVPLVLRKFLEGTRAAEESEREALVGGGRGEIRLCTCTSCQASGSVDVYNELRKGIEIEQLGVAIKNVGCSGASYRAPEVTVASGDGRVSVYGEVKPEHARDILWSNFRPPGMDGTVRRVADRLINRVVAATPASDGETIEPISREIDAPFRGPQVRIVTQGSEITDVLDVDEYAMNGGFLGLERCGGELSPSQVIDYINQSNLRGRGGAGYPSWKKWSDVAESADDIRYVICNADEGDPGAFMDRMILESYPYRVIEGMAIAAYAVGATRGYLYVRSEYPHAVATMAKALQVCNKSAKMGQFELTILEGAGAFVCGEETALIAAVEGRRGTPRSRPPYPSRSGLWEHPTLINNVETFASIPWILSNGPESFRRIGIGAGSGTKTFALAGKVKRGGLIEVPMGMTLRDIVEEIGGGVDGERPLKAIQIGGPSGGCIPASMVDLPVDYESLRSAGAIMGSGGLIILDDTDCMVDIARYFMSFTQAESCGQCTCCRIGTRQMLDILTSLCSGEAKQEDLETLEQLSHIVKEGSLCGLGRTAPNPVLSALKYFPSEFEAHLLGRCPAAKCRGLICYRVTDECIGCTKCAQWCPVGAIDMVPFQKHSIDTDRCIRCGSCKSICPASAILVE